MKSNKKIIGVVLVIILIALLFFFFQKSQQDSASNNKDNPATSSETLNGKDSNGNKEETEVGETEAASGKPGSGESTSEDKGTANDKIAEGNDNKQGITVYTFAANFGSTAEIVIDGSKFKKDYKYYQYYVSNKPVSNIESITKLQTTIFPAVEAGSQVELHLFDETQKEINKIDIKLIEKK